MTPTQARLFGIGVCLVFAIGTFLALDTALAPPPRERRPHAARTLISVCEAAKGAAQIVRAKVLNWGTSQYLTFPSSTTPAQVTPVSVQVLASFRGGMTGTVTVYLPGPFDAQSGWFLDGQLSQNQEVYLSILQINGFSIVRSQGYWLVSAVDAGRVVSLIETGRVSEGVFLDQITGLEPCPVFPTLPSDSAAALGFVSPQFVFDASAPNGSGIDGGK